MLLIPHFTKQCTKCKEIKIFTYFNKATSKRYGLQPQCAKCRTYFRDKNKEKIAAANKIYNEKNKEIIALKKKEYVKNNKDKINENKREYYQKNKHKNNKIIRYNKESSKKYYDKNKEVFAERNRQNYIKNKDKISEYFKSDIGKAVARASRYKRKSSINDGTVTKENILKLQQNAKVCYWCSKPLKDLATHLDHYIPLSRGGTHSFENLVISCQSCNNKKHAKDPLDFANSIGRLL